MFEGKFHIAENGDKMLYLWTDRADRPHRIGAYPTADCIREDEQTLSLKYGTNTFAPGTPFTLKEDGVFVAKVGDNVALSPLAGGNPTDLQKSFVSLVRWYVSKDGGESFELVQRTQGPTADNTDGPYASKTIRFEYVLPEITEAQNGYIYRCEVCYWDAFTWERTSYYYDATLYVDTPQLKEPDRYVDGQPAHCEKCGDPYGETDPDRHNPDYESFLYNDTVHKGICACGAVITPEEPHTFENGSCTKCYYDCRHTGGTATCTEAAICENCGERYGSAKGHTFGGWLKDAAGHWRACTDCGGKEDEAAHTPGDAATETAPQLCTVCHYEITPATGHTHSFVLENTDDSYLKSAATCRAKAVYYYSCACNACGERSEEGAHEDTDGNHGCDICQMTVSMCDDADNDHMCDVCGKTLTECADTNNDHKCDTCGKVLSECADNNKDHKCDVCGKTLTECADTNNDHKCDVCGKTLTECADTNNDHKCDTCGKELDESTGTGEEETTDAGDTTDTGDTTGADDTTDTDDATGTGNAGETTADATAAVTTESAEQKSGSSAPVLIVGGVLVLIAAVVLTGVYFKKKKD